MAEREESKKTMGKVELLQRLFLCTFPVSSLAAAVFIPGAMATPSTSINLPPLPLESSSCKSNGVMKPLILVNKHPVHYKTCNGNSFWRSIQLSMEQFFPRGLGLFLLYTGRSCSASIREDQRVINAMEH